jgi:hypothetical protein
LSFPFKLSLPCHLLLKASSKKNVQIKDKKSENKILRQPFFSFLSYNRGVKGKSCYKGLCQSQYKSHFFRDPFFLSLSVLLTLSLSLSVSLSLSLCTSLSLSLFISLSVSVSVSLSLSLQYHFSVGSAFTMTSSNS